MSSDKQVHLFDLLADINRDIDDSQKDLRGGLNKKINRHQENTFDDYGAFKKYKGSMLYEVQAEVKFKRKARKWSLIILCGFSTVMFINIFIMIYFNGRAFFPTFDSKIILAMITATFVNLFAMITLVFKYIFSPTSELMNHAKDMNGNN